MSNDGLARLLYQDNIDSESEAQAALKIIAGGVRPWLRGVFSADRAVRHNALKNLRFFLPARSLLRFIHSYVFRLGFREGSAGLRYGTIDSMHEYWIDLKMHEITGDWRGKTDRLVAGYLAGLPASPPADVTTPLVDVMIPTLNEAEHISAVVANARSIGNVYVLDSGSTDGTQELARTAGAVVVEHAFVNYSAQKNWGLDNLPFTAPWIFILDADERITPPLREEILATARKEGNVAGYYANRLPIFMGDPVRHGGLYPSWNLRLFRRGACRYENRSVHEHMICQGPTAYMSGEMLHIRREKLTRFIAKHIRYADMESSEWVKAFRGQGQGAPPLQLFTGVLGWRQWIRRTILPHLPARAMWRFAYMYFARLGFLDGKTGWRLARLMACYEYMIVALCEEKRRTRRRSTK